MSQARAAAASYRSEHNNFLILIILLKIELSFHFPQLMKLCVFIQSTLHAILNSTRQIFFCVKLFFITKNMSWFWQRHSLSNNNFNLPFPIHFYVPFSVNHILSTWSSFTSSMSLTLSSSFSMPMTYSYSSSSTSYVPSADSPEVPSCTQG